jgi:Dienelactone hydrolase family
LLHAFAARQYPDGRIPEYYHAVSGAIDDYGLNTNDDTPLFILAVNHDVRATRLRYASGKVGIIGYCSGRRQAYLAACRLPLDAAVDCYGAFVPHSGPTRPASRW